MMNNNKEKMHPEDIRNLIIFFILSGLVWFLYDTYIMRPQVQALNKAKIAKEHLLETAPEIFKPVKFVEREKLIDPATRIPFKNKAVRGTINLVGGQIDDLTLSDYYETLEKKKNIVLYSPNGSQGARYVDYGWVSADKTLKLPDAKTMWSVDGNRELTPDFPVKLVWDNGQGFVFERKIEIDKNFAMRVSQKVYNNSDREVTLYPFGLISQVGIPKDTVQVWTFHEGPVGFIGGSLDEKKYAAMKKEELSEVEAKRGWIGFSDKYWLTALIPEQETLSKYRFKFTEDPLKSAERDRYQTDFTGDAVKIPAGAQRESTYHLYSGAKKVFLLQEYSKALGVDKLDLAVDFGWFWFLTYPFFVALHYLGYFTGNMGVAIIILTVIVRGLVFPLSKFSYRSFAKMKKVSPQLTELRKKYGDDKEKLQQEILVLYQSEGVNPLSGCLPILVQIPIFFAFYKVIFVTIEIRHAPFFGWIQDLSAKDPTSVLHLFGLLDYPLPQSLMIGVWPCLMLIATLIQKQLNPPPQDKIQKDMMVLFPFFITYVMAGFASGLVIYWTVSAYMGIIQQILIMRSMDVPVYFFNKDHYRKELEEQIDKGVSVHPFVEMAENEAEKAMFGSDRDGDEGSEDSTSSSEKGLSAPKPKKSKKKK